MGGFRGFRVGMVKQARTKITQKAMRFSRIGNGKLDRPPCAQNLSGQNLLIPSVELLMYSFFLSVVLLSSELAQAKKN